MFATNTKKRVAIAAEPEHNVKISGVQIKMKILGCLIKHILI